MNRTVTAVHSLVFFVCLLKKAEGGSSLLGLENATAILAVKVGYR